MIIRKREANTILIAKRKRYFVLVGFCFCFSHLLSQRNGNSVSQQNLATSKIHGLKLSAVIANVKPNLSFALEGLDSKDSWSVAIFYFK